MTKVEKEILYEMRMKKKSYDEIAKRLSVSVDSVRSYCYRNHLLDDDIDQYSECICCGKMIEQKQKGPKRIFCSDSCRMTWRRKTRQFSETLYHHICSGCGKEFDTRGNKSQQYCSLQCYFDSKKRGAA